VTRSCVVVPDPGAAVHALREAQHSETLSTSSLLETNWCSFECILSLLSHFNSSAWSTLSLSFALQTCCLHHFGLKVISVLRHHVMQCCYNIGILLCCELSFVWWSCWYLMPMGEALTQGCFGMLLFCWVGKIGGYCCRS